MYLCARRTSGERKRTFYFLWNLFTETRHNDPFGNSILAHMRWIFLLIICREPIDRLNDVPDVRRLERQLDRLDQRIGERVRERLIHRSRVPIPEFRSDGQGDALFPVASFSEIRLYIS
jgi:hypothetical protein